MSILVSVPSVSLKMAKAISKEGVSIISPFEETQASLDCFKRLAPVMGAGTFCVNVPNVSISQIKAKGVSGPSSEEVLFVPSSLEGELKLGRYDKWRPYPAEAASSYALKMARKMTNKRIRAFQKIARNKPWRSLVYVEHSIASICHLDNQAAQDLGTKVFDALDRIACEMPTTSYVFFSPYGCGGQPGFVTTNRVEPSEVATWEGIREFLRGRV